MKKLLSMVLCAMMALTLAGCGGSSDDSSTYTYSSELDIKNLDSSDAEDGCSFTALHAIIDGLMILLKMVLLHMVLLNLQKFQKTV